MVICLNNLYLIFYLFFRLALGFSDRAIEAYDVLVALLESELSLILASCRAAGLDTACLSGKIFYIFLFIFKR